MENYSLRITGTVLSADVDTHHRDRLRRWLVTVRVDEVAHGELPSGADVLTMLVHSPSRAFADPDVVGSRYTITFLGPVEEPYAGPFEVGPAT